METTDFPRASTIPRPANSTSGQPGDKMSYKRRAPVACQSCRARKVRCDVSGSGNPCNNCRLDHIECKLSQRKRSKKSQPGLPTEAIPALSSVNLTEQWLDKQRFWKDGNQTFVRRINAILDRTTVLNEEQQCVHSDSDSIPSKGEQGSSSELQDLETAIASPLTTEFRMEDTDSSQAQKTDAINRKHISDITLPNCILPFQNSLDTVDIEYLRSKDAFHLPSVEFRNELLRVYVQFVYPFLPVIDLSSFLRLIQNDESVGGIGLALYQAILFTASHFVDQRFLTKEGYQTRKGCIKSFFERSRLLYDFDSESDREIRVQTLLHLSYWNEQPNSNKDAGRWLGEAITIARSIGMDSAFRHFSLSIEKKRLWRRIWWTCFTRDRLLALGLRRPPSMVVDDSTVPVLDVSDFELNLSEYDPGCLFNENLVITDPAKMETLAKLYIHLTRLCLCMTGALNQQQSHFDFHRVQGTETSPNARKISLTILYKMLCCDQELEAWHSELPHQLRYFTKGVREYCNVKDGEILKLHRALLHGVYLTTRTILHRAQSTVSNLGSSSPSELQRLLFQKARTSASGIASMYHDLLRDDLIRYLPNISLKFLLEAVIIHFQDASSGELILRQEGMRRLRGCMEALKRLGDMYNAAEAVSSFLAVAKRNLEVSSSERAFEKAPEPRSRRRKNLARALPSPVLTPSSDPNRADSRTPSISRSSFETEKTSVQSLGFEADGRLYRSATNVGMIVPYEDDESQGESSVSGDNRIDRDWQETLNRDFDNFINTEDEFFFASDTFWPGSSALDEIQKGLRFELR